MRPRDGAGYTRAQEEPITRSLKPANENGADYTRAQKELIIQPLRPAVRNGAGSTRAIPLRPAVGNGVGEVDAQPLRLSVGKGADYTRAQKHVTFGDQSSADLLPKVPTEVVTQPLRPTVYTSTKAYYFRRPVNRGLVA